MHPRILPALCLLLTLAAIGHSVWLHRRLDQMAATTAQIKSQSKAAANAWNDPSTLSIEDLALRFTHSELYDTREEFSMDTALSEFRRRGLLKRGMASEDVKALLGKPSSIKELETPAERPNRVWGYGLHASSLAIKMNPEGEVLSFTETAESDQPDQSNSDTW